MRPFKRRGNHDKEGEHCIMCKLSKERASQVSNPLMRLNNEIQIKIKKKKKKTQKKKTIN